MINRWIPSGTVAEQLGFNVGGAGSSDDVHMLFSVEFCFIDLIKPGVHLGHCFFERDVQTG